MTEDVTRPARDQAPKGKSRKTDPNAPTRKRRKRTVVSGAPDDCFTCSKRGARCDRRRPYCSQCLELGRECSGYKTTLTWGVGVASRGKLRGQKLPVMGESAGESSAKESQGKAQAPAASSSQSHFPSQPTARMDSNPHVSVPPAGMGLFPMDAESMNSFDSDLQRPPQMPNMPDPSNSFAWTMDMPDPQTWSSTSAAAPPQISGLPLPSRPMSGSRSSPSIAPGASMQLPPVLSPEASFAAPVWPVASNWAASGGSRSPQDADEELDRTNPEHSFWWNAGHSPSYSQLLLARSVGRTPRLRYLISYYAEVIAPMIVAFDSPTNPFRTHILRMAQSSEALQEAIATLATTNLRQRRERFHLSTERTGAARMSSIAHRALTDAAFQDRYGISIPEGYAREENHHRRMAVKALNADLADPRRRLSDSVLADRKSVV